MCTPSCPTTKRNLARVRRERLMTTVTWTQRLRHSLIASLIVATPVMGQQPVPTTPSSAFRATDRPTTLPDDRHASGVTLAAVKSLPPGARSVVQRFAGSPSQDVILLDDSSTTGDLQAALAVLRSSRKSRGLNLDRSLRLSVPAIRSVPRSAPARAHLDRMLADLRTSPEAPVGSLGSLRSTAIALPDSQP